MGLGRRDNYYDRKYKPITNPKVLRASIIEEIRRYGWDEELHGPESLPILIISRGEGRSPVEVAAELKEEA